MKPAFILLQLLVLSLSSCTEDEPYYEKLIVEDYHIDKGFSDSLIINFKDNTIINRKKQTISILGPEILNLSKRHNANRFINFIRKEVCVGCWGYESCWTKKNPWHISFISADDTLQVYRIREGCDKLEIFFLLKGESREYQALHIINSELE
jgi:hypothetical protein